MAKRKVRKISKVKIIQALATEPLRPGHWHHSPTNNANETCEVCAVGAILRQLKWNFSHREALDLAGKRYSLNRETKNFTYIPTGTNKFLSELSNEFENVAMLWDPDMARLHAISFVEGFFPKVLEVELD